MVVILHRDVELGEILLCNQLSMLAIWRIMNISVVFICIHTFISTKYMQNFVTDLTKPVKVKEFDGEITLLKAKFWPA